MIDRDIILVLIGAGIALISGLATTILQHFLSLKANRKKIEWEEEFKEKQKLRESLRPTATTVVIPNEEMEKAFKKRGEGRGFVNRAQPKSKR